jgi:cytidylate kinase
MKYDSVFIAGLPGSGKSTLAKKVSEACGWPTFSIGQMWRDKWKKLFPRGEVSLLDWWNATTPEENRQVDYEYREIVAKGNVVGDGMHCRFLDGLPCLKVFVTSDVKSRTERAMSTGKYDGKTAEEIENELLEREESHRRMMKAIYGDDYEYDDPKNYDLVLDSGKLSADEEVEAVMKELSGH